MPVAHVSQLCFTPHPRSTGPHPVTRPASIAPAQVIGLQQLPPLHCSPLGQLPQEIAGPQPLFTVPQVAAPQVGGVQA